MKVDWDIYYDRLLKYKHYTEIDIRYVHYYIEQYPHIFHEFVVNNNYKVIIEYYPITDKRTYKYVFIEL